VNYDQPRQLESGGWHYTTANRRVGTYPVGYCADHAPHETEDDARRCYRDYELNERLRLDGGESGSWHRCQHPQCETLTNKIVQLGEWQIWLLCDEHRTKESVAELYGPLAGDSMHS
jgi:hypothetical protein